VDELEADLRRVERAYAAWKDQQKSEN